MCRESQIDLKLGGLLISFQAVSQTMIARSIYFVPIFLGAFLLFLVQPIMGKFILPWFGGSSAVWTTCLLFFQLALLGGYAYAHALTKWLEPRRQAVVHLSLLVAALFFLPIAPDQAWKPDLNDGPVSRILALLLMTIGLPFAVLSATAPLLQKWFAISRPGESPYRLYALSNAGSVAALALHPFVVEPLMTRQGQSWFWSGGMIAFVIACAGCAMTVWRVGPGGQIADGNSRPGDAIGKEPAARRGELFLWLALSACGSVLLLSTTNEISQDVAVVPYLWVLPLGIYLITFIVCFDKPERYSRRFCGNGFLASLLLLCLALFARNSLHFYARTALYVVSLFFGCMVCHGELVRLKPAVTRMTLFYLAVAAGGAAGGLFVALVAPANFNDYYEHQLALIACAALVGRLFLFSGSTPEKTAPLVERAWTVTVIAACASMLVYDAWVFRKSAIFSTRNFYGAVMVHDFWPGKDSDPVRFLQHDNIIHGYQVMTPEKRREPTGYYEKSSGGGTALELFRADKPRRVGVVGLGVGTLAAYGRSGDTFRIYEIDPQVIDAAGNYFTFLSDSAATIEIAQGDGRLLLERETLQRFDILMLDAFTSDAVPVHLLTIEAVKLYQRHLKPDGILAFHLSSRNLDLTAVVRAAAEHLGLRHLLVVNAPEPVSIGFYSSEWMLVSSNAVFLDQLARAHPGTRRGGSAKTIRLWTDDYTSLLPVLK